MGGMISVDTFAPVAFTAAGETWAVAPDIFVTTQGASAFRSNVSGSVLINHGFIFTSHAGAFAYGVDFGGTNGVVTNTADAVIKGSLAGVHFGNGGGFLTNMGRIIGGRDGGVFLDVAATINNSGTISGVVGIKNQTPVQATKITNSGTIKGTEDGLLLTPAANLTVTIDNQAGGIISAPSAIDSNSGRVSLTNKGLISGSIFFDATVGNVNDSIINSGRITGVVLLGAGSDVFHGAAGSTTVSVGGGAGNDSLIGSKVGDVLDGGEGEDTLRGGLGTDTMFGGPNKDVFAFASIAESVPGAKRDFIADFQRSFDDIDLSGIDARTNLAGNQAFTWRGSLVFTKVAGQLRFIDQGLNCLVQADVNGDGKSDFEITVKTSTFGIGDFIL
ncbi:MAG TPA: M10 family metallopeptidase C-terminal domain-containing protein [Rhizobiaceae bacterium]|nr:M10 family metallopeptidase C-terminal domain-containing protein [Rhizobiaceae bacterium]